jgi:antitoxin ParD1/3/4
MTTSRNPSIALSERHRQLIDGLVASGRYQGVSEVVRESLRLLEDREAARARALAEIEAVVHEGIASGPAGDLDLDALVAEAERRAGR